MNITDKNLDAQYPKVYPPIFYTQDPVVINLIDVLDTDTINIKSLQEEDPYCKCIFQLQHIPSVKNKIAMINNIFFKTVQDAVKSFKALIVPKSLALTILANFHYLQGQAEMNKT